MFYTLILLAVPAQGPSVRDVVRHEVEQVRPVRYLGPRPRVGEFTEPMKPSDYLPSVVEPIPVPVPIPAPDLRSPRERVAKMIPRRP